MITLRKAQIGDLHMLKYWDAQEHVIASDPNDDWNWEVELLRDPSWREQLIAESEGQPIGFLQIIDPAKEETRYWGDIGYGKRAIDIWVGDRHNLGKGYGTQMMQLALERCFVENDVTEVLIDPLVSNEDAIRFYKRLGIEDIVDRWHQTDQTVDWLVVNYFKVITTTGMQCILKHDVEIDQWFLVKVF